MKAYEKEITNYQKLNKFAKANSVVLFGSEFAKNIPVGELKQTFSIDCCVYNRSFSDLSVFDAERLLKECVFEISPTKLLLQLGGSDLERGLNTIPEIICEYKRLISEIKKHSKRLEIVIISVCGENIRPEALNCELENMAREMGCKYADITKAASAEAPYIQAFRMLKLFIPDRVSFFDAMSMANI